MGWWESNEEGHSFMSSSDDPKDQMIWGDEPADIMADAIFKIKIAFMRDLGRLPSAAEIISGIKFTTNGLTEIDCLPATPRDATDLTPEQHALVEEEGWRATGGDQKISEERFQSARLLSALIDELTGRRNHDRPTLKVIPGSSEPVLESVPDPEPEFDSHLISESERIGKTIAWLKDRGYIAAVTAAVPTEGVRESLLFRHADVPEASVMMARIGDRLVVYPNGTVRIEPK